MCTQNVITNFPIQGAFYYKHLEVQSFFSLLICNLLICSPIKQSIHHQLACLIRSSLAISNSRTAFILTSPMKEVLAKAHYLTLTFNFSPSTGSVQMLF